jgi:hypothetical protein
MTMSYQVGDGVRLGNPSEAAGSTPFTDIAGTAGDPEVVSIVVKRPDGTLTTYRWPEEEVGAGELELEKEETGRFYVDLVFDQAGWWAWELLGSGTLDGAFSQRIMVERSAIA